MGLRLWVGCFVVLLTAGCKCGGNVATVKPDLQVTPQSLNFGPTKVGTTSSPLKLKLASQTKTSVTISGTSLANAGEPGGSEGFAVVTKPASVAALGSEELTVTFSPSSVQAYEAVLTISSDDAEEPMIQILLSGIGAEAELTVTPDCQVNRKCAGMVTVTPPSVAFAPEPFLRLLPIDVTTLPSVDLTNNGTVALEVSNLSIAGTDAAAFTFAGALPPFPLVLEPAAGRNLIVKFKPTSEAQQDYTADLVIASDDPAKPSVKVKMTGSLRPNLPPVVCANLVKVQPADDAELDYSSKAEWALLIPAPATGYDLSNKRNVEPRAAAIFSATSDAADLAKCTSDPEDGRAGLTYEWKLLTAPTGATNLGIAGATTAQATLRPIVTGEYTMQLTVKDTQLHATSTTLKFAVAQKQDLVAQLQWPGFADVDLDLHLVRPSAVVQPTDPFSGAFAFFEAGDAGKTAGDINGYAVIKKANTAGFDFEWGAIGTSDDPRLNIDDTGSGPLLENVSLNYPENDPKCATTNCTYKLFVHYFKDGRAPAAPGACSIDGGEGCLDGEACGCAAPTRCVADSAPRGDGGLGAGKCYAPPKPVVRIFLKGSPVAASTIPLDMLVPPDELAIGAPCQLLYVADVEWPSKALNGSLPDGGTPPATIFVKGADAGRVVAPQIARFGWRQTGGSLQCSPDTTRGAGIDWYARQP